MKKLLITLAAATAAITPVHANQFGGVYAEVTAGYDDVVNQEDATDVTYGFAAGINIPAGNVILGLQGSLDNVFDRRDVAASARLGYALTDNLLPYVKGGYANFRDINSRSLDGFRVGAGIQYNIGTNTYIKTQYRYSDFNADVGKHGALVGVGFRF